MVQSSFSRLLLTIIYIRLFIANLSSLSHLDTNNYLETFYEKQELMNNTMSPLGKKSRFAESYEENSRILY